MSKIPANSSQQFAVLMPAANLMADAGFRANTNWFNNFASVFVLLRPGADKARLEAKFPPLVKKHFAADAQKRTLRLNPFKDFVYAENPAFAGLINAIIAIAAFLLLIISINLINLNMASALPRAKEVAMRQVVGATKRLVMNQFWIESGIVVAVSLGLSAGFAVYFLIPHFNELREGKLQLDIVWATDYPTILTVLGLALAVALVAGTPTRPFF